MFAENNAVVELASSSLEGFCNGLYLEDAASITMRGSTIDDAGAVGVMLQPGFNSVDLGDSTSHGNNCIAMADSSDLRVYNRSSAASEAIGDYWAFAGGSADSSVFDGSVNWALYQSQCPGGAGGPLLQISTQWPHESEASSQPEVDAGLKGAFPNPFNPVTTIEFAVPAGGEHAELAIFDVAGRKMAELFKGVAAEGEHSVLWNGRVAGGGQATAGVYLVRLRLGTEVSSAKRVLVN